MGRINTVRVLLGGLVAGFVLNMPDGLVSGILAAPALAAELKRHGLGTTPAVIPFYITVDFLIGIAIVWLYAAMRPRFGPGPLTAIKAALILYAVPWVVGVGHVITGEREPAVYALLAVGSLVGYVGGGLAGAWLYREPTA